MAEKEKQLLQSSNLLRQQLAHGRYIPVMVIVVIIIVVIVIVPIIIVIIIFVTIIITNRFLKSSDRSRKLSKCPRKELVARLETNLRQQVCHPLGCHLVCHLRANFDSNRATTLDPPHQSQQNGIRYRESVQKNTMTCLPTQMNTFQEALVLLKA